MRNEFIDPKGDLMQTEKLRAMMARGEAYRIECKLRGVRFLPRQVMRPVYARAELADGPTCKSRGPDFLILNLE